jgi:hypothetical protein
VGVVYVPVEAGKKYEILLLAGYKSETASEPDLIINFYCATPNPIVPGQNITDSTAGPLYTTPLLDYTQCEFDLVDGGSPIKPARDATPQKVMRVSLPRKKSDTEVVLADGTTEAWASSPEITVPVAGLAGFIAYRNAAALSTFPDVSTLSATFPSAYWSTGSSAVSFYLYIDTSFVIPASTGNSPLPQGSGPFHTGRLGEMSGTSFTAATVNAPNGIPVGSSMKGTLVLDPATSNTPGNSQYPDEDCEVYLKIYGELNVFNQFWLIRPGTDWTVDEEGRSGSAILATFGDKSQITPITTQGQGYLNLGY